MTNETIRLIKNYLNNFTIETTPNIYNKYHYSNWILFKNFAKKIMIAYSKEG